MRSASGAAACLRWVDVDGRVALAGHRAAALHCCRESHDSHSHRLSTESTLSSSRKKRERRDTFETSQLAICFQRIVQNSSLHEALSPLHFNLYLDGILFYQA